MKLISYDTTTSPTKFPVHDYYSRTISKLKPKIRIIHITAPEIIKTDVESFRALVQKLTGKPADHGDDASQVFPANPEENAGGALQDKRTMKEEIEEIYEGNNPNAFLSYYAGVDMFFQDTNEFPLISNQSIW
ncbi:hypothetical protein OROHE_000911 [Orobanche hederae]